MKQNKFFKITLLIILEKYNISLEQFANQIGSSVKALSKRLDKKYNFRLCEIEKMFDILPFEVVQFIMFDIIGLYEKIKVYI